MLSVASRGKPFSARRDTKFSGGLTDGRQRLIVDGGGDAAESDIYESRRRGRARR